MRTFAEFTNRVFSCICEGIVMELGTIPEEFAAFISFDGHIHILVGSLSWRVTPMGSL